MGYALRGERYEIPRGTALYPDAFENVRNPPETLYAIGDPRAMCEGLAVVGARRATPYGLDCAHRFASIAAQRGICIISGGAYGCDTQSHLAALEAGGNTVVFHGPGIDCIYPWRNRSVFQRVIDHGGVIVSEHRWDESARPWMFRERNRFIAGLAKATLIVEAGLPSGTFSTADEAIAANREVLVVPGSISSQYSHGANMLIYQGATPVVDDASFSDQLDALFGESLGGSAASAALPASRMRYETERERKAFERLYAALQAQPMTLDAMREMIVPAVGQPDATSRLMLWVACEHERGLVLRYPDGRYGPSVGGRSSQVM